jgi:inner membrane protein
MDSLTQAVLGATVAAAILPASRARRAAVYGAVLGTLPDLDALVRFANPVDSFVYHRSATHSLLVLSLFAPLLYGLLRRFDAALKQDQTRWLLAFWLVLITHPLLDWFTNYGTQLFWPIVKTPFALSSVFIIDPIYTVPLLIASVVGLRAKALLTRQYARRACIIALTFSQAYLGWTLIAQHWIRTRVLAFESVQAIDVVVYAAPLTSFVYRVLIREADPQLMQPSYREAYISVFADLPQAAPVWQSIAAYQTPQSTSEINVTSGPIWATPERIQAIEKIRDFQRLREFSQGFYTLKLDAQKKIVFSDIRMGSDPSYVFNFEIAEVTRDGKLQEVGSRQKAGLRPDWRAAKWILQRIYTPSTKLPQR